MVEKQFLEDVATHKMEVLRNDGVYRHLRFRKASGSSSYWFDLVTWPGELCITGDMGTYVFRRLTDMFEFFRRDRPDEKLYINESYWAEKLVAPEGREPVKGFSEENFKAAVSECLAEWLGEYCELSDDGKAELTEAVQSVLDASADGEYAARRAAYNFFEKIEGHSFEFYELDCPKEYKYHFLWCCYAIAWGIKLYDSLGESNGPKEA